MSRAVLASQSGGADAVLGHVEAAGGLVAALVSAGWHTFTGVPCSYLAPLIDVVSRTPTTEWVIAPREDAAVGFATGMALAGRRCAVVMQNSGLGYSLNVLTSLNLLYRLPLLLIVSWRGFRADAPEHDILGSRMLQMLGAVGLESLVLSPEAPDQTVERAVRQIDQDESVVVLVRESL